MCSCTLYLVIYTSLMSIDYYLEKIKPYIPIITIVITAFLILGLWQIQAQNKAVFPLTIVTGQNGAVHESGEVWASKTGSKYYFPWCGALSRIKPENRVSFGSATLAKEAGYEPATNCKGVK